MAVFAEDSDEDSIATDTTAASEHDEDEGFGVEEILGEERDETGQLQYLVKWEGYPLHRASWEPPSNFDSGIEIKQWQAKKRAAANGGKPLFDTSEWEEAWHDENEKNKEKKKRRLAKRRKRGEIISRSHSPAVAPTGIPKTTRKASAASPIEKKGVAQKVSKTPQPVKTAVEPAKAPPEATGKSTQAAIESAQPAKKSAPSAPLIGPNVRELKRKPKARVSGETPKDSTAPRFRNLSTQNRYQNYSKNEPAPTNMAGIAMLDLKTGKPMANQPKPASVKKPATSTEDSNASKVSEQQASQPPVTSTTPAAAAVQAPPMASNTDKTPLRGQNVTEPDTAAMATARLERAKNQIEQAKGRAQQPPHPPQRVVPPQPTVSRSTASDIHSAYGRRTPPPKSRQRTPSPPPPLQTQPVAQDANAFIPGNTKTTGPLKRYTCSFWKDGDRCKLPENQCEYSHFDTGEFDPRQSSKTCFFWYYGDSCNKTADRCKYAHWDTGTLAKMPPTPAAQELLKKYHMAGKSGPLSELRTCYFWWNGDGCSKTAEACEFAHWDTGTYAPPPPGFQKWGNMDRSESNTGPGTSANAVPVNFSAAGIAGMGGTTLPAAQPKIMPVPRKAPEPEDTTVLMQVDSPVPNLVCPAPEVNMQDLSPDVPAQSIREDLELARKSINDLDPTPFLSKNGKAIENVYILMPAERDGERKLLAEYFKAFDCKVFDSSNPQHWKLFQSLSAMSLIVIHPTEIFDGTLPKYANFLWHIKGWVFSFGVHTKWDHACSLVRNYEARRAFPHGGITFISDDVFEYYPEKASAIIEAFHVKAKTKPAGAETSKIGARPGVRDWLSKLAVKKAEEGGENYTDDRYVKCWDAICDLCPLEQYDPWEMEEGRMVPFDESWLWSVAEQDLPSFQGLWEKDQAAATDMMANLFAGTAVERMFDFQRYSFIYQRPDQMDMSDEVPASQLAPQTIIDHVDPKGWMKRYNHIEVVTPDDWLRRLSKREKDVQATSKS